MTELAKKEVKNIRSVAEVNSDSGENQNPPPRSTPSWKMPWWLFRLLKFIIEMSPALGREISLLLEDFILSVIHLWRVFKKLLKWSMWATGIMLLYIVLSLSENVFKIEIPWYLIALPPVLSLAILILVLLFRKKEKVETPEDSTPQKEAESYSKKIKKKVSDWWNNWWIKGRLLPILACFALIHMSIYKLAPKFWVSQAWGDWSSMRWFWGIQIAIGIAASILPEDKTNPAKYKFSTVAVYLLAATFIVHLGGWDIEDKVTSFTQGNGSAQAATTKPTSLSSLKLKSSSSKYPRGESWHDKDVAEKILAGQWDLLAACFRESGGLKQFNPDGSVVTNKKNNDGTTDVGICQINSVHDAELKRLGLDKNKLEDNLQYAKILYEKQGLTPWNPKEGEVFEFEVEVTEEWSNTFKLPYVNPKKRPFVYRIVYRNPVILDFGEQTIEGAPGTNEELENNNLKTYKMKSKGNQKTLVNVIYQF